MYPSTPTHTEELLEIIKENKQEKTTIIKELIDEHKKSKEVQKMSEGVRYYFNESDITNRKIYTYVNDQKVVDEDATNNKLPASWHKRLVDQKVSYLAGKPATLTSKIEDDPHQEDIEEQLGDEFEDTLPELIKHASNKGKEWLHPYINEDGEFDYIIVPAQEGIPIYEQSKKKELEAFIRYYELKDDVTKIELWDSEQVTFYEEIDGEVVYDADYDKNPQGHFFYGNEGRGFKQYGWEKVPFIEFKNNEEAVNDLTFYKQLIDAWELLTSDTMNTILDVQSLILVLRGYEGTDLEQFITDLKRYKTILLSDEEGAGAEALQANIPTDATNSQSERLIEQIYQAGQGVNFNTDKFGQSPSGVALQFLYTALDMKCQVLERKFQKALKQFIWFICEYLDMVGKPKPDYKNYSFVFNKTMVTNETEQIANVNSSKGIVSDERLREVHPLVDDAQLETERMEKQMDEYSKNLPKVGEGNEPRED